MLFGIKLALLVFEPAENCSKLLQAKAITAAEAKRSADMTAGMIQKLRDPQQFSSFYNDCVCQADELGLDKPQLGRIIRRPKRFESGSLGHNPESPRDKYRQIYYEFIDAAFSCITARFDNPAFTLFMQIESVLIHCANNDAQLPLDDKTAICTHFGDDLNQEKLRSQLHLLSSLFESKVTHTGQLVAVLQEVGKCSVLISEVVRLVQLYLVTPASAATAERSFSAMRRLKTYLRSTMTSERLNSVMVLHVNKERADSLDIQDTMREFVSRCATRKDTFGLCEAAGPSTR